MKFKIISAMLTLLLLFGPANALRADEETDASKNSITFVSLATALERAKHENKMIMIFFWTDWCRYCQLTREKILPDANIKKTLEKSFISVSIDRDNSPNLAKKYKVKGVPAFIFLQPNGESLGVLPGYLEPPDFLKVLKSLQEAAK